YYVHHKRGDTDAPTTMRVEYEVGTGFDDLTKCEWLCFNHQGWIRQRAEQWWRERCILPVPETTEDAVRLANAGVLVKTNAITWREVAGEPFGSIIGYDVDDVPPTAEEVDDALARQDAIDAQDAYEVGDVFTSAGAGSRRDWFDVSDDDIPF
ncbi:MAG: hypothetical protein LUC93_16510, partial [Planctomycetaceae bacterium]|nr:hypothetical protein [Planctomycetaceae bacterium]